ncbi:HalOD1 output domain-containing protein [Halomarina oriensis]|uniref:Halobacterial output domain-containing protein n=1 Tax=Halomarina oriensis TaxID=671145 RepID=A0A6B0GHD8_9EURY|nr:HalOD1 output domain-containing protein [Halomarina oriensis]MWG34010.1 hypothetical protein [Halomarina oriensis]
MTETRPSVAVVEAIAREAGVSPLDLPPLYDAIDPDSLDRLLPQDGTAEMTFRYYGYEVTLSDASDVRVTAVECASDTTGRQVAVVD